MRQLACILACMCLACGLWPSGERTAPAPVSAAGTGPDGSTAPAQHAAPTAADVVTDPAPDARTAPLSPEAQRQALITAFLADCGHVPQVQTDDLSGVHTDSVCHALEFDQNCAPDAGGCWSAQESCKEACGTPCDACSTQCASSCGGCKSACAGASDRASCELGCAEATAGCLEGCLATRGRCIDVDCPAARDTCEATHQARVDDECGAACAEYQNCYGPTDAQGNPQDCEAKGAKLSEFCRSACEPWG